MMFIVILRCGIRGSKTEEVHSSLSTTGVQEVACLLELRI
jgi:hypothetical protein